MRSVLRHREAVDLLKPGVDKLRFVAVTTIPTGAKDAIAAGSDVTADVRGGKIPPTNLLTFVKRGTIIVQPETGNDAALDALARTPVVTAAGDQRDTLKRALAGANIPTPAHATTGDLSKLRDAALSKRKKRKAAANA